MCVQICTDGGKYLGGAIGNEEFVCIFLQSKVDEWREVEMLVNIAQTQPQAAYAAFAHGAVFEVELRLLHPGRSSCINCRPPTTLEATI